MKFLVILLTVMFTAARLCGVITWSWWLVFTPLYVYFGFWVVAWIVALILCALGVFDTPDDKNNDEP